MIYFNMQHISFIPSMTYMTNHVYAHCCTMRPFSPYILGLLITILMHYKFVHFQMVDGSYCCDFCKRKYRSKYSYEAHVNAHKGIYRYICPNCNKGFYNKSDLRGHMVSHTGKKEFKCEFCQNEYRYKSHLLQHMKIKHRSSVQK